MDTADQYDAFQDRVRRLITTQHAAGLLKWDQEVMMPEDGTPARAQQLSTLSALEHELLTDDPMGTWLAALDADDLSGERQAVVREIGREYRRAEQVSTELVEELSAATSEAHPVWKEARQADDFETFAPTLERLVSLRREYARQIDPDRDPYAVLFEEFEPYLSLETVDEILETLKDHLVPLIDRIEASDTTLSTPFDGTYPTDAQQALVRDIVDYLGYDWDRGRLDTAPHPFSSGTQFDARITTRFDETDPLDSITSTVHEFGHATYTQGLPEEAYGTPLGEPRDLSVHESQSRFWENHIGRSEAFWSAVLPLVKDHLPDVEEVTVADAHAAANRVDPTTPIRVEADELSYHLHIIIRYEIERALISGDLDVEDVPQVWNDKYQQYLGIRPDTDREGCLQDIHWSHASFGYFPTYSLGSVLAAQLDAAIRDDLAVDELVRTGEITPIREWLEERVHQHGCRYRTDELIERATGESLTAAPFCAYVTEKYERLYDLT